MALAAGKDELSHLAPLDFSTKKGLNVFLCILLDLLKFIDGHNTRLVGLV